LFARIELEKPARHGHHLPIERGMEERIGIIQWRWECREIAPHIVTTVLEVIMEFILAAAAAALVMVRLKALNAESAVRIAGPSTTRGHVFANRVEPRYSRPSAHNAAPLCRPKQILQSVWQGSDLTRMHSGQTSSYRERSLVWSAKIGARPPPAIVRSEGRRVNH